jgi:hypothetical protein
MEVEVCGGVSGNGRHNVGTGEERKQRWRYIDGFTHKLQQIPRWWCVWQWWRDGGVYDSGSVMAVCMTVVA